MALVDARVHVCKTVGDVTNAFFFWEERSFEFHLLLENDELLKFSRQHVDRERFSSTIRIVFGRHFVREKLSIALLF